MKLLTIFLCMLFATVKLFSQKLDTIYMHSGKLFICKVSKLKEFSVEYKMPNEEFERSVGKLAIQKIKLSSGRVEHFSPMVVIRGEEDFEKVKIIENPLLVVGLSNGYELSGVTSHVNLHSAGGVNTKAIEKMKREAARIGAPYILITSDLDSRSGAAGLGTAQGVKRGFAYLYEAQEDEEYNISETKFLFDNFFELSKFSTIDKGITFTIKRLRISENYTYDFSEILKKQGFSVNKVFDNTTPYYKLEYFIGPFERKGPTIKVFQFVMISSKGDTVAKYSRILRGSDKSTTSIIAEFERTINALN